LHEQRTCYKRSRVGGILKVFSLVLAILALSAGCSSPTAASQSTTKVPGTLAKIETGTGYSIAVLRGQTQVGALTLADLSTLDKVKFTADGKSEEGPTLLSALGLLGIGDFSTVTIYGFTKGRLATAEQTYERSKINDKVILDFSNQGTCKFAGADIPSGDWIIDVNKVVIQ
jgi:hypothetical protein